MTLVADDRTYNRIRVEPLTGAIGAEVQGVDLRDIDDETFGEIHDAWMQWKVLFFREQPISVADHVAFARRFSELEIHPFLPTVAGYPEVIQFESTANNPNAAEAWHTDVTFQLKDGKMLHHSGHIKELVS